MTSKLAVDGTRAHSTSCSAPIPPLTEDEQVSLISLPVELLDQIAEHLDNQSLLLLCKLSRKLNDIATRAFLKINGISGPTSSTPYRYLVTRLDPPGLIPALYAALWLTSLTSITFYFSPDLKRLVFETRGLADLIQRLEGRVEHLELNFGDVDWWVNDRLQRIRAAKENGEEVHELWEALRMDKTVWRAVFERLLDRAFGKGIKTLMVVNGDKIRDVLIDPDREKREAEEAAAATVLAARAPVDVGLFYKLSEWVHRFFETGQISTASLPPFQPRISRRVHDTYGGLKYASDQRACLKKLDLHSSMLLQPLFFQKTLKIFRTHAPVLHTLCFIGVRVSSGAWQDLLSSITLPALTSFIYMLDTLLVDYPTITVSTLQDFLVRHPTITSLTLYGILLPSQFPELKSEDILPNLEFLEAHPKVVTWLLKNAETLPTLTTVAIRSEYTASWMDHRNSYGDFDWALLAISRLPREIKLQLKLNKEANFVAWITVHVEKYSPEGRSEFPKLTNVKEFTVSCQYLVKLEESTLLDLVPKWVALLPCVEVFNLVEISNQEGTLAIKLADKLGKCCQSLKKFMVEMEEVPIPRANN
ncbi:hypothetical protein D9756_008588 [Leucocoprinus leucothites]|uniref:F-box domain-containing protein n=1 Tax=Leucocoprinus leucothites TaxID=201217 RepID=A0A8H5FUP2_9AGAR|nr:hypothetical protein D9756_008588 [Leucoagaricus leucothites]